MGHKGFEVSAASVWLFEGTSMLCVLHVKSWIDWVLMAQCHFQWLKLLWKYFNHLLFKLNNATQWQNSSAWQCAVQTSHDVTVTLNFLSSPVQYNLRGNHLCDRTARRGHRSSHHTPVSPEDRASRPARMCRQHAGLGHLHLPHLCGG